MIINLTQHQPTAEQSAVGVQAPLAGAAELLTFEGVPERALIFQRADLLARLALRVVRANNPHHERPLEMWEDRLAAAPRAMIGGAPYLMGPLEAALRASGIVPVYARSDRVSVEQAQPDGSVRKVAEFRHLGFVEAL